MSGPSDQILSTAARSCYTPGNMQTGINQLVDESVVARRTFYHHWQSNEALGAAYLELVCAAYRGRAASGPRS